MLNYAQFYQPGVPTHIELPTTSLADMCETAIAQSPDRIALDFFGRATTYAQLGDQISRVAEGLNRLGVRAGDRVALILPNCPQHVIAFYAILRLGAIVVEHNPLYTSRELRHLFEDHAARVAIVWDAAVEKLQHQPEDIELKHIISVNMLSEFPLSKRLALKLPLPTLKATRSKLTAKVSGTMEWKDLLKHRPLKKSHPRPKVSDIAAIQYTSGTTGQPKGAILTHLNLHSNARQGKAWMPETKLGHEVFYAFLPFFHAFGTTVLLVYGILQQARIHLFPTFDPSLVLAAAKKDPPTVLVGVPPIFEALAIAAKKRKISFKTAKFCLSGAMSLPQSTMESWETIAGGYLVEGYGMTESSPVSLGNPFHHTRRPGTVGLPFPSTQIKVVEADNPNQEVRQGERGELLVRGPQVFQGYWNNPEETAKTLLPGGWLATGDIVIQDPDGFTAVVDRKKELIITSGFNVSPTEVEIIMKSHPGIADAAVVALPHPYSGEEVVAAVVMNPGETLDVQELRTFCKARLAAYKVPRRFFPVETLPKSVIGKVLRGQVRTDLMGEAKKAE
ncbi:MAG: AMP-binding protein [Propionibacteriaceae bacterium]|jgi:long-chain acyl-CoA synthetase|nr:AMP-binding protein [Propionibacteriaceae bacterium]